MLTEIGVSLEQQLFSAGLCVGSRNRYFFGTNRIAPEHITHPVLCDLAHRAVEQLHLQDARFQKCFDLWLGDGGDVVKSKLCELGDLSALDHARVTHKGHPIPNDTIAAFVYL